MGWPTRKQEPVTPLWLEHQAFELELHDSCLHLACNRTAALVDEICARVQRKRLQSAMKGIGGSSLKKLNKIAWDQAVVDERNKTTRRSTEFHPSTFEKFKDVKSTV